VTDTTSSCMNGDEKITTWSELANLVEKYPTAWIFRGVCDAKYKLQPAIGRPGALRDIKTGDDLPFSEAAERDMLARFTREAHSHLSIPLNASLSHDWDLRAVAQHHGLSTRLLDWSESPLIAAFFAVEPSERGKATPDAALYGVPLPPVMKSNASKRPSDHEVVAIYPPHLTPRITVQRGLFTAHLTTPDKPWEPASLKKWVIPSDACFALKLALHRAGINRASLFPDLDGIAAHLNWLHQWGFQ
jgi:hypothetical protein